MSPFRDVACPVYGQRVEDYTKGHQPSTVAINVCKAYTKLKSMSPSGMLGELDSSESSSSTSDVSSDSSEVIAEGPYDETVAIAH